MEKKSLAKQFSLMFLVFAVVTTFISGVISYVNQTNTYHKECITTLERFTTHMAGLIKKEGSEFANIKEWYEENDYRSYIPTNFREDLPVAKNNYYSYIQKHYQDKVPDYSELDEEGKRLYVIFRLEYWLSVFMDATEEYGLSYAYFVCPIDSDEYKVRYLIDPSLETVTYEDGKEWLLVGDKIYEDPQDHRYMWQTWQTGEDARAVDSLDNEYGYTYAYCKPLIIDGEKIGLICADASVDRVNSEIFNSVLRQVLTSAALFILATFFLYKFISSRILKRISGLERSVEEYSISKDPGIAEKISKNSGQTDEIGRLSDRFAGMIIALEDYMINLQKITTEKERIGAELNVATKIQADMLPRVFPAFPNREDINIYATMNPAKEVGGDFYDFFLVDDKHIALVIADVSGKGVPAALFMVIAKALIKNRMQMGEKPAEALKNVNEQLCEGNEAELFVTVWLALINLETGEGIEANAGHEYPAIRHKGGNFELIKTKHSPAVATFEGLKFRENEFKLGPGDMLFVYTDGVTEATNINNELFGEKRLLETLNRNLEADPETLLPAVRKDIDEFVGEAPQFDDITMLGFIFYGPEGAEKSDD